MHRKTGNNLLATVPRHVKIVLKEDSEGNTEHHKVTTLLKLCITNWEYGIWIVTWNELTWNILKTPKYPNLCPAEVKSQSRHIWFKRVLASAHQGIESEEKGDTKKLWAWRSSWFFFSLSFLGTNAYLQPWGTSEGLDFTQSCSLDGNDWLTFLCLKSVPERSHCVYLLLSGRRIYISSLDCLRWLKLVFLPQKMPSAQGDSF